MVWDTVTGAIVDLPPAAIGDATIGVVWARGATFGCENADPVTGGALDDVELSVTDQGLITNGFFTATVGLGAESTVAPPPLAPTVTDPETLDVPDTAPPAPEPTAAVAVA